MKFQDRLKAGAVTVGELHAYLEQFPCFYKVRADQDGLTLLPIESPDTSVPVEWDKTLWPEKGV